MFHRGEDFISGKLQRYFIHQSERFDELNKILPNLRHLKRNKTVSYGSKKHNRYWKRIDGCGREDER
jgi:hypothetical protein